MHKYDHCSRGRTSWLFFVLIVYPVACDYQDLSLHSEHLKDVLVYICRLCSSGVLWRSEEGLGQLGFVRSILESWAMSTLRASVA